MMLARVGVQGIFFLALVSLLSAHDFGLYSTVLSVSLLTGTICGLGGNYLFASEVSRHNVSLRYIAGPLTMLNLALATAGALFAFVLLSIVTSDAELSWKLWTLALLFSEGIFGKSIEFCSIILQADKKFSQSQALLSAPAVLKALSLIILHLAGVSSLTEVVYVLALVNMLAWLVIIGAFIKRGTLFLPKFSHAIQRLANLQTPRIFLVQQSAANGVLFFVGDGAKPIVAAFSTPAVVASYSAALRLLEVALVPIKGLLFEVLHRWFDHSLNDRGERRRLTIRLVGRSAVSAIAFTIAVAAFGFAFKQKYSGFASTWLWLAPLILVRTMAYAYGDALVAAGKPFTRVACLVVTPLTLMLALASYGGGSGIPVAMGVLVGELIAFLLLRQSLQRGST
jgi:O-antigen/teichoic acid export membrane protein